MGRSYVLVRPRHPAPHNTVLGISAVVVLGITQMSHEQRVLLSARLSKLYLRRG